MKLYGLLGLFKNNDITFVEKRPEGKDSYLFSFKFDPHLDWKAGQHGLFQFKGEKMKAGNFRPFSVASTRDENTISILTKINTNNPSDFKLKLKSLEAGDIISLRGPFGGFYISDFKKPKALIAGGIGITPMRAILKDISLNDMDAKLELFYIDSSNEFPLKGDIEEMTQYNENIKTHFIKERGTLYKELTNYVNRYNNESEYFISGSPSMVKDIRGRLKAAKIRGRNIVFDSFRGY